MKSFFVSNLRHRNKYTYIVIFFLNFLNWTYNNQLLLENHTLNILQMAFRYHYSMWKVTLLAFFMKERSCFSIHVWWRHQMETFSALLAICAGNSPVTGEFHAQRRVTRSFGVFFDLRLNKRLSKQSWGLWFEAVSHPLWRHCNADVCPLTHSGRASELDHYWMR